MSGADIAAQVHAGLLQAASATGAGASFISLLRRKVESTFEYFEVVCIQTKERKFDATSMVVRTNNKLLVSAQSEQPKKGDHVAVGRKRTELSEIKNWARIGQVDIIEPAGVPLLYRAMLDE